jgi:chromosome segregation protein
MTRVTKLTAQGFKSFAKRTELSFGNGFNCVLGPNGSGKSNIMDALCFVLGKTSAKSMRADKSANLIYNGGKSKKPHSSAEVAIYFDNSNKKFPLDTKEVKVSRVIKQNGQSNYLINDKKMTRQQVVDILSSSSIDPDGHNIILQGDIVHFTNMRPIDRRLLIEEIAGISVFEDKKIKALSELEKVEEKLTEANILLTEREAHLRELKKDRDQAKKYLDLKNKLKDNKATYATLKINEVKVKKEKLEKLIDEQQKKFGTVTKKINEIKDKIDDKKTEIQDINKILDESGEREQLTLREGITNIKTDLVEAKTRTETLQKEIIKIKDRKSQLETNLNKNNKKIESLFRERNQLETDMRKVEKQRSNLSNKSAPVTDFNAKVNELARLRTNSQGTFTDPSIERISSIEGVHGTISELGKTNDKYELALEVCAGGRIKSVVTSDDTTAEKCIRTLKENRLGIVTFLPLNKIKTKSSREGINSLKKLNGVHGLAIDLIKYNQTYHNAFSNIFGNTLIVEDIETARKIGIGRVRMVTLGGDLIESSGAMIGGYRRGTKIGFKREAINDKKVLHLEQEIDDLRKGTSGIEGEKRDKDARIIELTLELNSLDNQINMYSDENERTKKIQKDQEKDKEEFENEISELNQILKSGTGSLKLTVKKEKEFFDKLKEISRKRNKMTEEINKLEGLTELENEKLRKYDHRANEFSVFKAKHVAEIEGLQKELEEYPDGKIRRGIDKIDLKREIDDFESMVQKLGNINMRALEIYEDLVKEHENLVEKTSKIKSEKSDVLDMIEEIEQKKTDIFMETYNHLNTRFRTIFNTLSTKGEASLAIEDKEVPLNAGIDMTVRIAGNKFLDIRSLSGGEKTLAALAFIFAIQEYNPASFYILDEVDAALDKHNSEKLGVLFKQYSGKAQYIVISHNDAIISEADRIFGISMQEGVSKITSLKL